MCLCLRAGVCGNGPPLVPSDALYDYDRAVARPAVAVEVGQDVPLSNISYRRVLYPKRCVVELQLRFVRRSLLARGIVVASSTVSKPCTPPTCPFTLPHMWMPWRYGKHSPLKAINDHSDADCTLPNTKPLSLCRCHFCESLRYQHSPGSLQHILLQRRQQVRQPLLLWWFWGQLRRRWR